MENNPQRRTAIIWWAVTAIAAFAIFAPYIFGMNGASGGFAISFLSIVCAITALIVAIMYMWRAGALEKMLRGDNLLAHWTYPPDEWRDYAEKEYKRESADKRSLFYLVAGISLVVGIGFWIAHPDSGWVVLGVLSGLILLIAVVAYSTTRYNYFMNRKYLGEAYVSKDGVYLNRQLHLWRGWGARFEGVECNEKARFLAFRYSTPNRSGRSDYTVRVPVPIGREQEARGMLVQFQSEGELL